MVIIEDIEQQAWEALEKSIVYYRGEPIGNEEYSIVTGWANKQENIKPGQLLVSCWQKN